MALRGRQGPAAARSARPRNAFEPETTAVHAYVPRLETPSSPRSEDKRIIADSGVREKSGSARTVRVRDPPCGHEEASTTRRVRVPELGRQATRRGSQAEG